MVIATAITVASGFQPWFLLRTSSGSVVRLSAWRLPVLGWLVGAAALGLCLTAFAVVTRGPRCLGFVGLASGLYTLGLAVMLHTVGSSAARLAALIAVEGETLLSVAAAPGLWLAIAGSGGAVAALCRWLLAPPSATGADLSARVGAVPPSSIRGCD